MNHPNRETWMSYLYDELPAGEQSNLAAHLAVCPECKASVETWRGVKGELAAWRLQPGVPAAPGGHPWLRWAAAAAVVIGVGFGVGRMSAGGSAEEIRASIEPAIRLQLRQEFAGLLREELARSADATLTASGRQTRELVGEFARVIEENRRADNRAVMTALGKLETQRLADYAALKHDLDTVAVFSEAGFRRTQNQLVQLAGYTQPASSPIDTPSAQP